MFFICCCSLLGKLATVSATLCKSKKHGSVYSGVHAFSADQGTYQVLSVLPSWMCVIEGKDVLRVLVCPCFFDLGIESALGHLSIANSTEKVSWHQFGYKLAISRVACGLVTTKLFRALLCMPQRIRSVENKNRTVNCFLDNRSWWNERRLSHPRYFLYIIILSSCDRTMCKVS